MTHVFFKVQSKKNLRGFRGSVSHVFFKMQSKKNPGVRGSVTHLFFKVLSKKESAGGGVRGGSAGPMLFFGEFSFYQEKYKKIENNALKMKKIENNVLDFEYDANNS